jgi:HAD superfamily hydrolase (TIGR01509 family)
MRGVAVTCIIFDLDGTLVDSETLSGRAFAELVPDLSASGAALALRYRGIRFTTILADIEARVGRRLPEDFETRYRARVATLFDAELEPMPGAAEMLEQLTLPRCVASNGPQHKIRHALRVAGLARFFGDHIFSAYDIGTWKPDPGLFLHAAAGMGAEPTDCLSIEDSWVGVEGAVAAGMQVWKYTPAPEAEAPRPAIPVIADLREIPDRLA